MIKRFNRSIGIRSFIFTIIICFLFTSLFSINIVKSSAADTYPTWNSGTVYTGGNRVEWNGKIWEAKWWTLNEEPGKTGEWGVWKLIGDSGQQKVATPAFSVPGGTYNTAQSVSISCSTGGATIYYTTNGTEPTESSAKYSNPINITVTTTLKAKAFFAGMSTSDTASVTYVINTTPIETVATPSFSLPGGTYSSAQNITISCTTAGATIYYTTNGLDPTESSSKYSGSINIASTTTLKAKAFKSGMNASAVFTAVYTISGGDDPVATPWAAYKAYVKGDIVSYAGKNYECSQPHTSLPGWEPSNVPALWADYKGDVKPVDPVAAPVFNPAGGSYSSAQSVTITCSTVGATIYYTTNGSEPTESSQRYSGPISIPTTTTIKAKGFKSGMTASVTASVTYTIKEDPSDTVATPAFSIPDGTYNSTQVVSLTCATADATIRYTTDGTEPSSSSPQYNSALTIAVTTTLKAKAFKSGMKDSATATASYRIEKGPVTNLPARVVTGYWHNFDNGSGCLKISDVPIEYNLIVVAFAEATTTPGRVTFNLDPTLSSKVGGYTKQDFINDIAAAKVKGQKVIISVGGETGTVRVDNSAAATNFTDSIYQLMQEYGFDGVDIDLENGVNDTYMANALRSLSSKVGSSLIITMAPQTIDMQNVNMGYFKLALAIKDILTICNMQYYNSGTMLGQDGAVYSQGTVDFLTALAAIQLENGLRPDQVGLGLPATTRAAGGGYVNPSVVNSAINCLVKGTPSGGKYTPPRTYPSFRGAMTWSINWDATNNYSWVKSVYANLMALGGDTEPIQTVATPVLSPIGGIYTVPQTVSISCATAGAVIRYTTNGSEPTASSAIYNSPLNVSVTTTLKAKAFKNGMNDSLAAAATFTIVNNGGNGNLPKHILIGYWHTWGGGPSGGVPFVKLRDVDPNWDVINIAFAEPVAAGSTDGRMKLNISGLTSDYTINDFKADIKALQSQGKKIVLSIGGYEGYFSLTSTTAVNQFVSDIKGFINEYGFDGIDIDLEQSSVTFDRGADPDVNNPRSPKIVNMISAVRQICNAYGDNFILSWAPETFYMQMGYQYYSGSNANVDERSGVYLPMINALRDKTTYVHTQLYNSITITGLDGKTYSMGNTEAVVAMCEMLLQGFAVGGNSNNFFSPLRPDQVAIGVPASAGSAGSGHITNQALQQAFTILNQKYPTLRGIMTWSINWDVLQNSNEFAKSNGAYLDSLK